MEPEIVWEDPPTANVKGESRWAQLLEPLRSRPGVWARFRLYPSSSAASSASQYLRNRPPASFPKGKWEIRAGKFEGGGALWARYLGPEEE